MSTAEQLYDFSTSDFILMIGGKVLLVIIIIMVVYFGVDPSSFPANQMRQLIGTKSQQVSNAAEAPKASEATPSK